MAGITSVGVAYHLIELLHNALPFVKYPLSIVILKARDFYQSVPCLSIPTRLGLRSDFAGNRNYHIEKSLSGHDPFEESAEEVYTPWHRVIHGGREAEKLAELREKIFVSKFGKKLEDAKAKAAVKAQIEADKKARAEKAAWEKALRDGQPIIDSLPAQMGRTLKTLVSKSVWQVERLTRPPYQATQRYFLSAQTLSVDVETVTFAQEIILSQSV
ncbi:hypothetical protein BDR06DRAFT_994966 [Suillus hirtellus]|nr:hypothetical protein BDR06DRAFT_994966 [Suillus hirtellus]